MPVASHFFAHESEFVGWVGDDGIYAAIRDAADNVATVPTMQLDLAVKE